MQGLLETWYNFPHDRLDWSNHNDTQVLPNEAYDINNFGKQTFWSRVTGSIGPLDEETFEVGKFVEIELTSLKALSNS